MKYFDRQNNRLVFIGERANDHFWNRLWEKEDLSEVIKRGTRERLIKNITGRFLPITYKQKSPKILEGGCGRGEKVFGLKAWGYDAYGVDYAEEAVARIKKLFPDLAISVGDVRHLGFADGYFDGYWSLGVIEHFFEGYESILEEMKRVIRSGGYLFITFPYVSPLRRLKALLGFYPPIPLEKEKFISDFYQFALPHKQVIENLKKFGFQIELQKPFDAIKGLKDELHLPFARMYRSTNFFARVLRYGINLVCEPFASHVILIVAKRK